MPSDRHADRLALGPGAVFPVSKAAELLPVADTKARAWLRARGLTSDLCGREVVVWAEVLAVLATESPAVPPARLPRRRLDPL